MDHVIKWRRGGLLRSAQAPWTSDGGERTWPIGILPILTYKTLDEAFQRMASTPRPLTGFVFSRDRQTIARFLGELSYGGGAVNQVSIHLFVDSMPFGGTGSAGLGHYYGKYGFDMLTHAKSMLVSPLDVAINHLFPLYTPEKDEALKAWFEY
jgi:aldehyde dehydrogenase (NAD+)